ncbi:MAG: hypothetical protein Q9187_004217 [Circinaria calcarea]
MAQENIPPKPHPGLHIPSSDSTVQVQIINTTCDIVVSAGYFVQPVIKGQETLNLPTCSFLVENKELKKTILFDLGSRTDWWNLAPVQYNAIQMKIRGLRAAKGITEILVENGLKLGKIDGMVWSHWHWDHIGDPSLFPQSAELIVGPGVKEAFLPGYPARKDSPLLEADFKGRDVHEITFDGQLKIGQYRAHDFFGDGSFYLLDVPGHAIGHMSALARTTPTTFILMGGDVCHFGGSFRPTAYAPLPSSIPSSVNLDRRFQTPCPCSTFTACHPNPSASRITPFYHVSDIPGSYYTDPPTAQKSIDALEEFDADENVLVCIAHDVGLRDAVDWYPNGTGNDWKEKGWKEKSRWEFLNELPIDGKPGKEVLVKGLVRDGRVEGKEGNKELVDEKEKGTKGGKESSSDWAPDLYETPELTDGTSTRPTSTAFRSESRASSYKDLEGDEISGIDRHRLDPDEARTHFLPARVHAGDVDFSDRIDGKRKSYQVTSRRRRKGTTREGALVESSDEDDAGPESLQRKIARLQQEAEEIKVEIARQHAGREIGAEEDNGEDMDKETLDVLSKIMESLNTIDLGPSRTAAGRLGRRVEAAPAMDNDKLSGERQKGEKSAETISRAPKLQADQNWVKIADFDTRITLLETILGIDSIPLPTQGRPANKAILPTLDILDRKISTISSSSPASLDAVGRRIRQLIQEAEKLDDARKSARASLEALKSSQDERQTISATQDEAAAIAGLDNPEQSSKINALFGTLPTIESLAPLLPSVLDRLRSLRLIHADAAAASQSLADVEKRQAEMAEEIRGWREGLEKVEERMRTGEKRLVENTKVIEDWVEDLEGRMGKLGRGGATSSFEV